MARATLLFADNDEDFRRTRTEFLEQEGYRVIQAGDPTDARRKLESGDVDLAILDLRLVNDQDDKDTSGLIIAKDVVPDIPKIILTKFSTSPKTVREALKAQLNGPPTAIDFVDMGDGVEMLIASIRLGLALRVERRVQKTLTDLWEELSKYFAEARKQATFTHRTGIALLVIGDIFLIAAAIAGVWGQSVAAVASAISGLFVEGLAFLFKTLSGEANKRMDKSYQELLRLYREHQQPQP